MKPSKKHVLTQNRKKPFTVRRIAGILFVTVGCFCILYPFFSQYYYRFRVSEEISTFYEQRDELEDADTERRIALAEAYNESLLQNRVAGPQDPYQRIKQEEGRREYARMLELHEQIGFVQLPRLGQELPVYAGTDESVLQKGVGHLESTSLPVGGVGTHAVLTAHTGLPTARLFTDLDSLQIGDRIYYKNLKETLAYQVVSKEVVLPEETQSLRIDPQKDQMTLLTCTPLMVNSHRLLVHAERIAYRTDWEQRDQQAAAQRDVQQWKRYGAVALVFCLFLLARHSRKKERALLEEIAQLEERLRLGSPTGVEYEEN